MRLTDADELKKKAYKHTMISKSQADYGFEYELDCVDIEDLENAPTVDAELVRHGHWIETIENGKMKRVTSCCGDDQTKLTTWYKPNCCPNCGAKMDEVI